MSRTARVVIAGYPHHVIQRGNRSQKVFFDDNDKKAYIDFLRKYATKASISFWAYCIMDNHVHLIAVPENENSLAEGMSETHKNYTRMINFRQGWRGYLWQGRFISYPLDEQYLYAAVRYVERNPVRAGLVKKAEDYLFSSAKAHVLKQKDILLSDNFMFSDIEDWSSYLAQEDQPSHVNLFKRCAHTGRPLGDEKFIIKLEELTGKVLRVKKPGPKKRS